MKNLNIKQYHQAYHPFVIPANIQNQQQLQNQTPSLHPHNSAVVVTTTTNQKFNNSNYSHNYTATQRNFSGCKTLPASLCNSGNNSNQNLSSPTPPPPTLGGYLANQQQQRLHQQQQLNNNYSQHTPTVQQINNMLGLNQSNTCNYNFQFNDNYNNDTSHNFNFNTNASNSNNNRNMTNINNNNHNSDTLSRPQRPSSLNFSSMDALARPSYSTALSMSNESSTCQSESPGACNFTSNHFYNNNNNNNQRENLLHFPISQQQQQLLHNYNHNLNYNLQQHQQNYSNYQANPQQHLQQQQLQQFQIFQQQLKQQQKQNQLLQINNNNNNNNISNNSNHANNNSFITSSAAMATSSGALSSSSTSPAVSSSSIPLDSHVAAVNPPSEQANNNCDKITMDAGEIANFLANELFMQQLVSMECMQTGVPTLTTPTLTPTTLKSIEESFIQLTSEPINAPYQAGFIPPPLVSYISTPTNTTNNNSALTITTTSVAAISPNAALNNVYVGDTSGGASLPDYGNINDTESENSQGSWTANHLNEENSLATTDTSSAATDTTSFQNGLNSMGVNTLNNSNSSATEFTTFAALAVATAAAKISNAGNHNHNNNNTSSSATTTTTPTRRGGGRRPTTNSNMSPEEEEKRRIRRERNKLAAARCRKRRVDQTNELTGEVQILEEKREELQKQIESLNGTKQDLEFLLEAHRPTCQRVEATDILSVNGFEGLMPSTISTAIDNITGLDTSLATTARSISPLDLKPVLNDQLLAQIKAEPLDSALDSNSSLDQDGPPSPKRLFLSNNNPMIPPPLPNVATLSASLAAASASLNTPIATSAPVSFGSMYSNNPSLGASLTKPNSKQRPNSLPTIPRKSAQTIGLNVHENKPPTAINGVAIQTPSTGMFNFDSLMDGGTGLTPVSGPLVPTCSSQNKHPLELVTPTSEPSKLVSL